MQLNSVAAWWIIITVFVGCGLDFWLSTSHRPTITDVTRQWREAFPMLTWLGLGLCYHLFVGK